MPAKSQAQFRAMQAAAHGNSTLGISQKVGQDFVGATGSPKGLPEKIGKKKKRRFKGKKKPPVMPNGY